MRLAYFPGTRRKVTVAEYVSETGAKTARTGDDYIAPDAQCPACLGNMYAVRGAPQRIQFFRHRVGLNCPASRPAGEPYLRMTPVEPDVVGGIELRRAFIENWRLHYSAIRTLAPCLSPEEFLTIVGSADELRVWEHRALTESWLPQTLVLLIDFPPWTGLRRNGVPERDLWLRFWYQGQHETFSALWIDMQHGATLCRASFEPPRRETDRPRYENLRKQSELQPDRNFLNAPAKYIPAFIVRTVEHGLT
ncbi:hypothetical protein GGR04_002953 [Aureimonas pseudogalii]|uniref:Uncharacterized protein n=1 Tax=Aureimonas pseudogalii TaxID=1744844 RepID=A0A7W6H5V6_9HYPH|nr:hypothetical protein [Aureimonas pseudogalii]